MDEARRFVRYITPGGVFVVEVVGLLLLLCPTWVVNTIGGIKEGSGLGPAVAGLFATGTLGFLLSTIHHTRLSKLDDLDYSPFINELIRHNLLKVTELGGSCVPQDGIGKQTAFAIVTALWHQLAGISDRLRSVDARAQRLADFAHSLGTAYVASLGAGLVAGFVALLHGTPSGNASEVARFVLACLVGVAVPVVLHGNFQRTADTCRAVVEQALSHALVEQKGKDGRVVTHMLSLPKEKRPRRRVHND